MSLVKILYNLREKIITCCKKGDYVLITKETKNILKGEFNIEFLFLFDESCVNSIDFPSEKKKKEMRKEYKLLIRRFSNLLVEKIPVQAIQFRQSPRYPTSIFSSPCFSGTVALLQLLFAIPPIRKLYIHSRWIDGVPKITKQSSFVECQAAYLHEMISVIFDQMLVFCSYRPEEAVPIEKLRKSYEETFMAVVEKVALVETSPDLVMNVLFNSLSNPSIFSHPAFERVFKETFLVEYTDHNQNIYSDFCIHLYIDRFVPHVFYFRDIYHSVYAKDPGQKIKEFVSTSEYLLFDIDYHFSREYNICIIDDVLEIIETNEFFDLVGMIYSYFDYQDNNRYRSILKYGKVWYMITNHHVQEIDLKKCKDNIMYNDNLRLVIYKKRKL